VDDGGACVLGDVRERLGGDVVGGHFYLVGKRCVDASFELDRHC
jgi:hypothetical protein